MATTRHILLLKKSVLQLGGAAWEVEWHENIRSITNFAISPEGNIIITAKINGEVHTQTVPCKSKEETKQAYKVLKTAGLSKIQSQESRFVSNNHQVVMCNA